MKKSDICSIILIDCESFFAIVDSDIDNITCIPYGAFSATVANIEYDRMIHMLTRLINDYSKKICNPDYIPELKRKLYKIIDFYVDYTLCLDRKQKHLVTQCLLSEMMNKFIDELVAGHGVITDIEKCMPFILYNPKIRNDVKNILEGNSNDLTSVMQETETDSIEATFILDIEKSAYYIYSPSDYLLIDLNKYLKHSKVKLKECECCHRLFIPTRKSDKYCNTFNRHRLPKKCRDIMHISPNDEFVKIRNKARDKQHKQIKYYDNKGIYEHNFLYQLYDNWSDECAEKFTEFKATEDIEGFKNWIEKTKFTKERLTSFYEDYKKDNCL